MDPVLNFIDGAFVPAQSGATLTTVNPATGDVITTLPKSSTSDVEAATTAALQAASAWSATTMEERIAWLHRIADALEEDRESVAQLESTDTGKPIALARRVDAARSVANFRFFAEFGAQHSDPTFTDHGAINHLHRSPIGCVGLITPWNLPLYLLSWKVAPALLMGNTIVAKPSELTPLTANHLAVVMQRIGFPDGVFNLVHGLGPDVGQAIVEHPDIRGVSFTGGTATGKIVAATAAPMFKKLSLELGGKTATVVLDDAP
ncbi:MAG: aldehyde dehydrogenase family protein, partial [Poseidonia sp.]